MHYLYIFFFLLRPFGTYVAAVQLEFGKIETVGV